MAILLSLLSLSICSYTSFSSAASLASYSDAVMDVESYNYGRKEGETLYTGVVQVRRDSGATRTLALIAKGAFILAVLFLLVRCAAYISGVSSPSEGVTRRLSAGEDPCGGVSGA